MPFCSLSSGHSSVCQITDLFVQACPRQSAMEQGWQVLSHCFMITEGHLALRNLLLGKQRNSSVLCTCSSHPSIIQNHRGEERNTVTRFHLGPGWTGKKKTKRTGGIFLCKEGRISHTGSASLAPRTGMSLKRNRERLLIRDSPSGESLRGCYSQYWYGRLENSPTQQMLQPTTIHNPQNLYLVESLLL